jgi:FixJ family two-component response regulator
MAVKAMRGGAVDFLNKPFSDTDLLMAVDFALAKQHQVQDAKEELHTLQARYKSLTPRERQILEAVSVGKANKVIAFELDVTESTVKVHRHNAMLKMCVRSVADLTRLMDRLNK